LRINNKQNAQDKTHPCKQQQLSSGDTATSLILLLYKNIIYVIFYTHPYKEKFVHDYVDIGFDEIKYMTRSIFTILSR